jgi:hypothetical protein
MHYRLGLVKGCKKVRQNMRSYFQRGKIVGACLAGASATKTATLFGVSRPAVYKVMMVTHIMGRYHQPFNVK